MEDNCLFVDNGKAMCGFQQESEQAISNGSYSRRTREEECVCSKSSNSTELNVGRLTGLAAIAKNYTEDKETSEETSTDFASFKSSVIKVACFEEGLDNKSFVKNTTDVVNNNNEGTCEKDMVSVPKQNAFSENQENHFKNGNVMDSTLQIRKCEGDMNAMMKVPDNQTTMIESVNTSENGKEQEVIGCLVRDPGHVSTKPCDTGTGSTNIGNMIPEPASIGFVMKEQVNIKTTGRIPANIENERTISDQSHTATTSSSDTGDQVDKEPEVVGYLIGEPGHVFTKLVEVGAEPTNIGNMIPEPVNIGVEVKEPVSIGTASRITANNENDRTVSDRIHTATTSSSDTGDQADKEHEVVGYLIEEPGHVFTKLVEVGVEPTNIGNMIPGPVHIGVVAKEQVNIGTASRIPANVENERTVSDSIHTNKTSSSDTGDQVYAMPLVDQELDGICKNQTTDQNTTETDTSSSESSSDSDDESSSSESSTSSDDDLEDIRREIEKEEEQVLKGPPRTKSEVLVKDLPEIPDLDIAIEDNVQLVELGVVFSIVESMVVVKALPQTPALDTDSILFLESRSCLGLVFETFGPVQTPFYSVRFNEESNIRSKNVHVGDKVFYAPDAMEYSHYVFVAQLKRLRGSDASWEHDEEPPQEVLEYSDDEEEAKARASRKKERKAASGSNADGSTTSTMDSVANFHQGSKRGNRKRTWQNRAKGQTVVSQNQNQGIPPSQSTATQHTACGGSTHAQWHGSTFPVQAPQRPLVGHPSHDTMHFIGLSEGLSRGEPPVRLPPWGPPSVAPLAKAPGSMGQFPVTGPGPITNVSRPSFGPPRPLAGGPGIQGPWMRDVSPMLSPRYPFPAPRHLHNPRGNIQSFPGRGFMDFVMSPPPPPPPPM